MKKTRRIVSLLLAVVTVLGCSMTTLAASGNSYSASRYSSLTTLVRNSATDTVIELEKNQFNQQGQRQIKVDWNDVDGATDYQLQVATDSKFKNCVVDKQVLAARGTYYTVLLDENVTDTYYLRVRPRVTYAKTGNTFCRMYGSWSNVVTAEAISR